MNTKNKLKIFNDPIHGFITIPNALIFDLVAHRYFQRLRRISQMGLSYLVYPGAHHTRFHHALGCLHLMQKAVRILRFKGVEISEDEENGLYIAILLHDIGHGPFSHAMEHSLVHGVSHEAISLRIMEILNVEFRGKLTLAIEMFKGQYHRAFFGQLISGQLDMDRSDYLKRDSFYTGVSEGNINSERLISMMTVVNDQLVIEEKGIYSIEKFLTTRRLMYWQVYLHKTGLVAEHMIINLLKRAKTLAKTQGISGVSPAFEFFLNHSFKDAYISDDLLEQFVQLDDFDIIAALKSWQTHHDFILSDLSKRLLERRLFKIKFHPKKSIAPKLEKQQHKWAEALGLSHEAVSYYVFGGSAHNTPYNPQDNPIKILHKNGSVSTLENTSDLINIKGLTKTTKRHYLCYPKKPL